VGGGLRLAALSTGGFVADEESSVVVQARLTIAYDDLRIERQKVLLLIQIVKGLADGSIDPENVEVTEDGTQVQLKNADLVEGN